MTIGKGNRLSRKKREFAEVDGLWKLTVVKFQSAISVSRSALGGSRFTIRVPNQTRRLHGQETAEPFELERSR